MSAAETAAVSAATATRKRVNGQSSAETDGDSRNDHDLA
jgi:hypothetical protein